MKISPYLRLLRPVQWYKNLFVLIPAVFSGRLFEVAALSRSLAGFFFASLFSSAGYIVNDIVDLERDMRHPRKRSRPIASGQVSVGEGLVYSSALLVLSAYLSYLLDPPFALLMALMFSLSLLYSLGLKEIPVVDVLVVSVNYVIRSVSGAFLIHVEVSPWLIAGIFFVALLLALGKRRAELLLLGGEAGRVRRVYQSYTLPTLDRLISTTSSLVVLTWALYCIESPKSKLLSLTVPIMTFVVLRYLTLISSREEMPENPHEVILEDRGLLAGVILLVTSTIVLLYI